jgi:AcrR family transcriptional regulator
MSSPAGGERRRNGTRRPDSRERILEAAWRLVTRSGVAAATLAEIAAAAGVSRQLVYLHFGSRGGVLVAMVRHRDATRRVADELAAIFDLPSAERSLAGFLRWWCGYIPEILPVARALEAASVSDEAAAAAWQDRMAALLRGARRITERLDQAGRLAEGWDPQSAAEWCWAQMHVSNWQHLVVERGWSERKYTERLVRSVRATLVGAPATPRRRRRP